MSSPRPYTQSSPRPHTHSSLITHSPDLFNVGESPGVVKDNRNVIGRTPSKGRPAVAMTTLDRSLTARMLTFNSGQDNATPPSRLATPPLDEVTPPREERTILDIPSLYAISENEAPPIGAPPGAEESASQMAFALCTPTKDDRRDFYQAFDHTH